MDSKTALIVGGVALVGFLLWQRTSSAAGAGSPFSYGYQGAQGGGISEYQAAPAPQLSRGERIVGGITSAVTGLTGLLRGTPAFSGGRITTK